MASQMKSCRPKTPGGKALMPESPALSLSPPPPSSFSLPLHLPLSPPHPHSFTQSALFLLTSLTVSHFTTPIISTIAVEMRY